MQIEQKQAFRSTETDTLGKVQQAAIDSGAYKVLEQEATHPRCPACPNSRSTRAPHDTRSAVIIHALLQYDFVKGHLNYCSNLNPFQSRTSPR